MFFTKSFCGLLRCLHPGLLQAVPYFRWQTDPWRDVSPAFQAPRYPHFFHKELPQASEMSPSSILQAVPVLVCCPHHEIKADSAFIFQRKSSLQATHSFLATQINVKKKKKTRFNNNLPLTHGWFYFLIRVTCWHGPIVNRKYSSDNNRMVFNFYISSQIKLAQQPACINVTLSMYSNP